MLTYRRNHASRSVDVVFLRPNVKNIMYINVESKIWKKKYFKIVFSKLWKIFQTQLKFLGKVLIHFFIETNISIIDCPTSIHQKKASWWIVCVKFLEKFQFLNLTKGEIIWILNWFWTSPKQCQHKKQSTDENGKWNLFVFVVRWCLLISCWLHFCWIFFYLFMNIYENRFQIRVPWPQLPINWHQAIPIWVKLKPRPPNYYLLWGHFSFEVVHLFCSYLL